METPRVRSLLDLSGKVALVTGAGRGLGRAVAARFAEAGAGVAVHYRRSAAEAAEVVAEITRAGGRAIALDADLTREDEVGRLVARATEALGGLDVLVNNAGSYPVTPLLEMKPSEWEEVLSANLRTTFLCTHAAARRMLRRRPGGAIVN